MKQNLRFLKRIIPMLALAGLMLAPSLGWGQTATVTTRPTHIDLALPTSESAVLMTLSGYTSNDARYRVFSGSSQYNCWDEATDAYIASNSYGSGPQVPGTPSTSTTFWILFQRGNNNTATASYRDRLGTGYDANYQTAALPAATSISLPFNLTGTFTGFGGYNNTIKHVVLGLNGSTIVTAASTTLTTGAFTLVCPGGTTINKIEIRAIDNTLISSISGSWTTTTAVGNIPTASTPAITVTGSFDAFTSTVGTPSASQSVAVSGANLTSTIDIGALAGYEYSTTNADPWSSTLSLASSFNGNVYVRLNGTSVGTFNGNVSFTSTGASQVDKAVAGVVNYGEPSNHATEFAASVATPAYSAIDVDWIDAIGETVPQGYVVKVSKVSFGDIGAPEDGTPETPGTLVKVVNAGVQTANFTGLEGNTAYYFKIWPYTNSGAAINFKIDGNEPQVSATTVAYISPRVLIARNCDPNNNFTPDRFAEIYNAGVSSVDLTNWTLENIQGGNVSFVWILSGLIAPGQTLVCGNVDATGQTITPDFTATWIGNSWNGKGGDGSILKNSGVVIDNAVQSDVTGTFENGQMKRKLSVSIPTNTYSESEWVFTLVSDALNAVPGFHGTVWRGTGTVWTTESNWDNLVPNSLTNVTIPSNLINYPSIDNNTASPASTNNLTIALNAIVTIPANKALTISGILTNNAGAIGLKVSSDATGTGSLIHNTADVPATIERYVSAANWAEAADGWHLLSSPVAAQSMGIGNWTPTEVGNDYDLYVFDETRLNEYWLNQKVGANNITTFLTGKGYLAAYQTSATKTFAGNVNVADVTLNGLTNTPASAFPGWHLVGNPFASAIDYNLGSWTKTNIDQEIQVWNSVAASYKTATEVGGIVPAMNGFMVHTSGSGVLTIPANARAHNAANWYKSEEEFILLKANDIETNMSQSSIVRFNSLATDSYDANFDSYFLQGFAPAFYSSSANEVFALNTLPEISNDLVIPFGFIKNASSDFSIELEKSVNGATVYLTDKKTNTIHKLSENPVYSFTSAEGDNPDRFLLHFGVVGIGEQPNDVALQAYVYGNQLFVINEKGKANLQIFDVQGRLLQSNQITSEGLNTQALDLPAGVYVVRLQSAEATKSVKVIVQ